MIKKYTWIVVGLLILAGGCVAPGTGGFKSQSRPGGEAPAFTAANRSTDRRVPRKAKAQAGILTLGQALELALMKNPSLEARHLEVRAAEARMVRSGLPPNPVLGIDLDDYDHEGKGFDSSVTAVALGQVIELGGKRRRRRGVAEAEAELAGCGYESERLDLVFETTERFIDVLAAQDRIDLAAAAVELAGKTAMAVTERVKAGKEPPLQAVNADTELEMARLDAFEIERELHVSRKRLAAAWGSEQATFEKAEGDLDHVHTSLPPFKNFRARLSENPDLAVWRTMLKLREAALESEKAGRWPDLEASAGVVKYNGDGTHAFTFGLGIPLPLFNRNQGNVVAAAQDLLRTETSREAAKTALVAELAEKYAELMISHKKAVVLGEQVVPARTEAFDVAHEGYQQGKFDFLDVLGAQRSMFEARRDLVDALAAYHKNLAAVQRLTTTNIEEPAEESTGEEK